jgi:hypothetical protein
MGARENLQRLIDRKQQEVNGLEEKIRESRVYMQALQDAMKSLPREASAASVEPELRPGTAIFKAREAIRQVRQPMHINDLLGAIGKPSTKKNKISLAGTIAWYARKGQIFKRTAPNTFGLMEIPDGAQQAQEANVNTIEEDLPASFGT